VAGTKKKSSRSSRGSSKRSSAPEASKTTRRTGTRSSRKTTPEVDPDTEVNPTGQENPGGTAQNQLGLAPPMRDDSGSNILPGNLRQPLAEGAEASRGASLSHEEQIDPALDDPEGTARQRVEGRTSDAANRTADGPQIDDVPADINDGPKPSDGGPERYPFPQGGDVDVATVDPGSGKDEYFPNLEVEDWVILDGSHELVPDRLDGRRAVVLDAPRYLVPYDEKDNVWITVRTRDDVNATLQIPFAAVKEVQKGGLAVTHRG
jgi:hypothetical protein